MLQSLWNLLQKSCRIWWCLWKILNEGWYKLSLNDGNMESDKGALPLLIVGEEFW